MTTKMLPSQQRKRPLFGLFMPLLVMAAGMAGGCEESYRINHLHNDANQKAAEQSLQVFEDFTSQTAGLEPTLLKNIDARKQLEDAVGASRSRVRDTQAAGLTTDATWERLRLETYVKLGLLVRTEDGNIPILPPRPLDLNNQEDFEYARNKGRQPILDIDGYPVGNYDQLLSQRIVVREMKVTAVAKVLKLIGDANHVLTDDTNKRYKQTQDELQKSQATTKPAVKSPDESPNDDHVQWVRELFQKIVDSRQAYATDQSLMKTANELQRKVLAEIESSRDPVEAVALVPIVGTGLSDFDFAILDAYIKNLQESLTCLKNRVDEIDDKEKNDNQKNGKPATSGAAPENAWTQLKDSLCQARIWVALAVWLAQDSSNYDPDNTFLSQGVRPSTLGSDTAEDLFTAVKGKLRDMSTSNDPVEQAKDQLKQLLDKCEDQKTATGMAMTHPASDFAAQINAAKSALSKPQVKRIDSAIAALGLSERQFEKSLIFRAVASARTRDGSALQDAINSIHQSRQSIKLISPGGHPALIPVSKDVAGGRHVAKKLVQATTRSADGASKERTLISNPKTPTAKPTTQPDACKNVVPLDSDSVLSDPIAEKGFQFLNQFLGLDAKIAGLLKNGISDKDFKVLGGIVDGIANDIQNEQAARHERTLTFLDDLYGAAVDLGQENTRHAQGMLTIANIELRRWALIGLLNDNYQEIYTGITTPATSRLFQSKQDVKNLIQAHKLVPPASDLDLRNHPAVELGGDVEKDEDGKTILDKEGKPVIQPSDRIWTSIRKLSETAEALHKSAQVNDPDGFNIATANDRLFKAVRTVDGHLLMISLNQHISEENVARLHAELASHDIRLDTLKTRVEEAGYRLTLGDLKAFHSSGITDQDIQNIADAFANGFLAWIGSGTNSGAKK